MPAIRFQSVWKSFPVHRGQMLLRDRLLHVAQRRAKERFHALREINFEVGRGESVALIGPNGAGKSTLLTLAAGLSRPDRGVIQVHGHVATLLELGSGFHYDLTGAENVRINAALLGMSRKATLERFDQIVDFSGIREFINEPLRTYSSGMVMRLAFAVAVSIEPEVLVVDEVLGVGDEAFFQQCVGKILEFKRQGKTILCASHATEMVKTLCERALWLDHGRLLADGEVSAVTAAYHEGIATGTIPPPLAPTMAAR
jgi:ABC-type polysaccharide/polyol phosphate transport system ATPase subunit